MKKLFSVLCVTLLAFLLCACASIEPDLPSGTMTGIANAPKDEQSVPLNPTATKVPSEPIETSNQFDDSTIVLEKRFDNIKRLELFIDSTYPMMGFVDLPSRPQFTTLMDCMLTAAKSCFPNSAESAYRVSVDQQLSASLLQNGISISMLSQPSFFLSQDLTVLPDKVYAEDGSLSHSGERMNEFKQSYFHLWGLEQPQKDELRNPVKWALDHVSTSPESIAVIVSDLSEIQNGYSDLHSTIQDMIFSTNKTIGIIAVRCNYSGLLPLTDGWAQWGSMPSGSLWKLLDYGEYRLGVTIEAEQRITAQHPLYILCIGSFEAVNGFINSVQEEIDHRFGEEKLEMNLRAFDIDIGTKGVDIADSVMLRDTEMEGINYITDGTKLPQVKLQRMPHPYDRVANPRCALYEVVYPAKRTDPRLMQSGGFTPNDFVLDCQLYGIDGQGGLISKGTPSAETLGCTVDSVETVGSEVHVLIRLDFPYKALERGDYQVKVGLTLTPPREIPEPEWVSRYHTDANSGKQFDGSRTVGLNGLFSSIASGQNAKTASQYTPLGSFTFNLSIKD